MVPSYVAWDHCPERFPTLNNRTLLIAKGLRQHGKNATVLAGRGPISVVCPTDIGFGSMPRTQRRQRCPGHFGKWHLSNGDGTPLPTAYGFDQFNIFNGPNCPAGTPPAGLHDTPENAMKFILANKEHPFLVNIWLHESHLAYVPTKASMEKWKHLDEQKQVYAAVITDGDDAVGRVLDALKEAGIEKNTIVLFSSDNGPESTGVGKEKGKIDTESGETGYGAYYSIGSTGGLQGRKRSLFEGGVRVPL